MQISPSSSQPCLHHTYGNKLAPAPQIRYRQLRGDRISTSTTCTAAAAANLYELLGTNNAATIDEIKSAYRKSVTKLHPDVNPGNEDLFKAVLLAYQVLADEQLRQRYDRLGVAGLSEEYAELRQHLAEDTAGVYAGASKPGADLSTVLGLELKEALAGAIASVSLEVAASCTYCQGSGFEPRTHPRICSVCGGSGGILCSTWQPNGRPKLLRQAECPNCRGSGWQERTGCPRCNSSGIQRVKRKVQLKVPAGVMDGQVLRLRGMGDTGQYGGAAGDLFVKLQVYNLSQDMVREGSDLFSPLALHLYDALLGCNLPVTTIRGPRMLKVPPGTQDGAQLSLPGAGVARPTCQPGSSSPDAAEHYGCHFFNVKVQVPNAADASPDELRLMEQLAQVATASQCSR